MKKTLTFLVILFLAFGVFVPTKTNAAVLMPFGGLASFSVPCLCSGTLQVWFAPLYVAGTPIVGSIDYSPFSTILYANFLIGVPGVWHLGNYVPGVPACWQPVLVGCAPVPSFGIMTQVGTSRLVF